MNWRKHLILIVGGGVCAVLIIIAAVMLFRYRSGYASVKENLDQVQQRLDMLNRRDPFPSEENINLARSSDTMLQEYFENLVQDLRKEQIEPVAIERAEFAPLLEKVSRRLFGRAKKEGIVLPDRFALGFSKYAAGELPKADSIARLVVQLRTVDLICNTLMDSKISEIAAVERQVFEDTISSGEEAPSGRGRRGQRASEETARTTALKDLPMAESNDLYSVERYGFTFVGREDSVWDALNQLAASKSFITLVDIRMENEGAGEVLALRAAAPAAGQQVQPAASPLMGGAVGSPVQPIYPSHEERLVGGRESVRVSLVLDVYRFLEQGKKEEATP